MRLLATRLINWESQNSCPDAPHGADPVRQVPGQGGPLRREGAHGGPQAVRGAGRQGPEQDPQGPGKTHKAELGETKPQHRRSGSIQYQYVGIVGSWFYRYMYDLLSDGCSSRAAGYCCCLAVQIRGGCCCVFVMPVGVSMFVSCLL